MCKDARGWVIRDAKLPTSMFETIRGEEVDDVDDSCFVDRVVVGVFSCCVCMSFVSCIDGAKDMERIVKQDCTRPKPWARRIVSRRVYLMLHSRSHTHTHTHVDQGERASTHCEKERKNKKEKGRRESNRELGKRHQPFSLRRSGICLQACYTFAAEANPRQVSSYQSRLVSSDALECV